MGELEKFINPMMPYVQSITTATLTKLFAIRIAASKYSERTNSLDIMESVLECSSLISLMSAGLSEKNATSDADTNPDTTNKEAAKHKATIGPTVTGSK
jgi:hypothetical protein